MRPWPWWTVTLRRAASRERDPADAYLLPTTEYLRRAGISAAVERNIDPIVTNSDGDRERRDFLLSLLGAGATERIIDPGLDVVRRRLSVDGALSDQCSQAINRWYSRL